MFSFFGGGGTFQEEYKSYLEEGCAEDIEKATFDNIKVVARAVRTVCPDDSRPAERALRLPAPAHTS